MKLLAIETSSPQGSVAFADGDEIVERTIATPREQTARVLPLIGMLLADAGVALGDLDAIVFGRGPGSFTGLRIAGATAQGLALAAELPVAPVSSLAAIAQRAWREHRVERALVAVDARMGELYWGRFRIEGAIAVPESPERLTVPADVVAPPDGAWSAVGSGFVAYAEALEPLLAGAASVWPAVVPTARDLVALARPAVAGGRTVGVDEALPVYLRGTGAWRRP
jgi:tRNA threonylcarbamoyladenosine biosynthesis protein TsaB